MIVQCTDNECFIVNVPVLFHFRVMVLKSSLFDCTEYQRGRCLMFLSDEREMHRFICNCFDILNLICCSFNIRYVILIEKSEFLCSFLFVLFYYYYCVQHSFASSSFSISFLFFLSDVIKIINKKYKIKIKKKPLRFNNKSTAWIFIQNCTSFKKRHRKKKFMKSHQMNTTDEKLFKDHVHDVILTINIYFSWFCTFNKCNFC